MKGVEPTRVKMTLANEIRYKIVQLVHFSAVDYITFQS